MTKLLLILFIGLVCETTGVILLKKGMIRVGDVQVAGLAQIVRAVKAGVTEPQILWGVFFEALFFICLLILMAKSEISFLWPLTALSFVFATFGAMWFLNEKVSPVRWAGVVLIMMGAALISYSEHIKDKDPATVSANAPSSR